MTDTHGHKIETLENKLANLQMGQDKPIQNFERFDTQVRYKDTNPFSNKQPYNSYQQQRNQVESEQTNEDRITDHVSNIPCRIFDSQSKYVGHLKVISRISLLRLIVNNIVNNYQ